MTAASVAIITATAITATESRTGRSLVTEAEFETLASFCADEYGLERCVAEGSSIRRWRSSM